jgi:hypothetical protein
MRWRHGTVGDTLPVRTLCALLKDAHRDLWNGVAIGLFCDLNPNALRGRS